MLPMNSELGIMRDMYFDKYVAIERKNSLDEFAGNCVKERDRIKKEFTFAPEHKVLLIENATYQDMINGNYRSEYSAKSYFGTVHSFWHEYNLPVFFMPDNSYSAQFIYGFCYYYVRDILK